MTTTNQLFLNSLTTSLPTTWNSWYTTNCLISKTRYNLINTLLVETITINVSSLGLCDKLESNYIILLTELITQKKNLEIETLQLNLEIQLAKIENEYNGLIKTSIGFGWLALICLIVTFLIMVLMDIFKKCSKTQILKLSRKKKIFNHSYTNKTVCEIERSSLHVKKETVLKRGEPNVQFSKKVKMLKKK